MQKNWERSRMRKRITDNQPENLCIWLAMNVWVCPLGVGGESQSNSVFFSYNDLPGRATHLSSVGIKALSVYSM